MTGPSINLRAARTVAGHAHDAADCRLLLDVLGLVDDDGRLRPDGNPLVSYRNLTSEPTPQEKGMRHREREARCGTASGYLRHRRHGEKACQPCLDAAAAYQRDRARKRREAS